MEKRSKEMKVVIKALNNLAKKYDGNIIMHGGLMGFKGEDCEVVEDMIFAYGDKESLKISMDEMSKMLKKEKKNSLVNW